MSNPGTTGGGLRKVRRQSFVQVPSSTIRDVDLSFRARGVLAFLLDHPDGWTVDAAYIARNGTEGREAVETALRELRAAGYYRLERRRLPGGAFAMGTAIAEEPVAEWAASHAAHAGRPVPVAVRVDEATGVLSFDELEPAAASTGNGFPGPGVTGPGATASGADAPNYLEGETDSDVEGAVPGNVTSAPSPALEAPKRTCRKAPAPHGSCGACADDRRALEAYEAALNADALEANRRAAAAERAAQAERRELGDAAVDECRRCNDAGIATVALTVDGEVERHDTVCQHDGDANRTAVRARLAIRKTLADRPRRADDVAIPEHRARARARELGPLA